MTLVLGVSPIWADLNSVVLHARWTPDLTTNTQPVCVKGGTVGGGVEFHLVAYYSPPVNGFVCDSMVIEELTSDHPPQTMTITSFSSFSSLGCCSSPPPSGQSRALFCTTPKMTYSFHNADYRITANYHYMIMQPPPNPSTRVDGSVSITVHFENLIVNSVPKILKWDPDVPENCDTTLSYSLSSAQKKNCQVVIKIYNMEGNVVYQTTATQLCPGNYSFTWDGMTSSGTIAPTGLYTFDIIVNGKTPDGQVINEDKDQMRSQIVSITQTSLALSDNENYPSHYKFSYYLTSSSGKPPSSMEVTVYAPAGDDFKVYKELEGGKTIGVNEVYFDQGIIEVGGEPFYVVASGWDDELSNKAHTRKPLLEKNKEKYEPTAAVFTATGWEIPSAKGQMTSGAFTGFYLNHKPQFIRYSPMWTPLHPKLEPQDMLQPAQSKALALNAMRSVDVFVFGNHGNGEAIEFSDGAIFQTEIPQNNLYLVVIGTCRGPGVTGFPIVEKIVSKSNRAKKCGIGVGGPTVVNGWKYIYTVGWRAWSRWFWKIAAKEGLTMWKAAEKARDKVNKKRKPYYKVEVFHYGGDDYLGHVFAY